MWPRRLENHWRLTELLTKISVWSRATVEEGPEVQAAGHSSVGGGTCSRSRLASRFRSCSSLSSMSECSRSSMMNG
jgi:hypothetical protein